MEGIEPGLEATAPLQDRQRLPPAREAGPLQRLPLLAERRRGLHRRGRPGDGLREDPPLLPGPRRRDGSSTLCSPRPTSTAAITQGIGAAIYEQIAYDEDCQPLTATFMDYTIPTAVEVPTSSSATRRRRRRSRRSGRRASASPASARTLGALCSAIENALPGAGPAADELPLTPSRVWGASRTRPRGR